MPLFGPPDVNALKEKHDVQGLSKAMSYKKDAKVRKAAVEALVQMMDGPAAEVLLSAAIKDPDSEVRELAAGVLRQAGDEKLVERLNTLQEAEAEVRWKEMQPRCARCGQTSGQLFEKVKAGHNSAVLGGAPVVQIGNWVGICPQCRKPWCKNHWIDPDPNKYNDDPKCPNDKAELDMYWDRGPTEEKPWRIAYPARDST